MKLKLFKEEGYSNSTPARDGGQFAFTWLDLVAVLAICSVLIPLMVAASQKSEEDVRRMQCRNNLRQIGVWLTEYAENNDGFLPINGSGGWTYDLDHDLILSASTHGASPANFYCPSGTQSEGNGFAYHHYNFTETFANTDYVLAIQGTPQLRATNVNRKILPEIITLPDGESYLPTVSERELAADVVMSTTTSYANRQSARFFLIQGGSPIPHRTNHMIDERPAGGNILYLDGHIEWRDFDEMVPRTSGFPTFWY